MGTRPLVIGIAGGTASGKTTVARRIVEGLGGGASDSEPLAPDIGGLLRDEVRRRPHSDLRPPLDAAAVRPERVRRQRTRHDAQRDPVAEALADELVELRTAQLAP